MRSWGLGMVALGWAWWLTARLTSELISKLISKGDNKGDNEAWWRRELTIVALTTAFLGLLPLTLAAGKLQGGFALTLFETAFAAAFVLFALEEDRTRKAAMSMFGLLIAGLAVLANRAFAPDGVTLALVVCGIVYALLALRRREAAFVSAALLTLSAAYLNHLRSLTSGYAIWYSHSNSQISVLSWPQFAFYMAQAALLWLLVGWQIRSRSDRHDLAHPFFAFAGGLALLSGFVALLSVQTPGGEKWSVLTLGWAGGVWFALWALKQGEICLHVATWNIILAWSRVLYGYVGTNVVFMDLYLLPVGFYLLTVGYLQAQRQQTARAQWLWIAGLLLMITPAFLAFWNNTGDIHTLLFIGECLLAAVWGIWQRIRAFVLVGTGFIALYAASVVAGHLPDVWATLVTLLIGIALFVAGFYILTHRAVMQRWVAVIDRQWKAWQAWR